jgi:glyoxylate/hydroxypyruvate reductase A
MPINILFAASKDRWQAYEAPMRKALTDVGQGDANLALDIPAAEVDYIVFAPNSDVQDFTPYRRTKAVLNLWAGVEGVVGNKTLTQPLARMVDEGLTQGMVDWVVGHTMRHHLNTDLHVMNQDGQWRRYVPPLATDRPVTILGLGALGKACGEALASLGFPVTGWSRTQKDVPALHCLSGEDGLKEALSNAEILILLLPHTPDTENLLNTARLAQLPQGAVIINPGRGALIDDHALLSALDADHISHATLDVFRVEPLPADHPYWSHAKVTVTPHIASETRPQSASRVIAENIRRGEAGEPFLHLVDRSLGY